MLIVVRGVTELLSFMVHIKIHINEHNIATQVTLYVRAPEQLIGVVLVPKQPLNTFVLAFYRSSIQIKFTPVRAAFRKQLKCDTHKVSGLLPSICLR